MRNTLGQKLDGLNKIIKTEGNKELFNSILIESTEIIKDHIDSKNLNYSALKCQDSWATHLTV